MFRQRLSAQCVLDGWVDELDATDPDRSEEVLPEVQRRAEPSVVSDVLHRGAGTFVSCRWGWQRRRRRGLRSRGRQ
jgi:hypothetical protein